MATDRELLEAAARAAGIRLEWDGPPEDWAPMYYEGKTYHAWNPLADDGDALRLAVKLNMRLSVWDQDYMHHEPHVVASVDIGGGEEYEVSETIDSDPYAATRRAIVRAAVAIGGGV